MIQNTTTMLKQQHIYSLSPNKSTKTKLFIVEGGKDKISFNGANASKIIIDNSKKLNDFLKNIKNNLEKIEYVVVSIYKNILSEIKTQFNKLTQLFTKETAKLADQNIKLSEQLSQTNKLLDELRNGIDTRASQKSVDGLGTKFDNSINEVNSNLKEIHDFFTSKQGKNILGELKDDVNRIKKQNKTTQEQQEQIKQLIETKFEEMSKGSAKSGWLHTGIGTIVELVFSLLL